MKGFTLIELMIVVAIIAIIAAIAIPSLLESKKAANEASAVSSLRTLSSSQELYRTRVGNYGNQDGLHTKGYIDAALADADTTAKSGYFVAVSVDGSAPAAPMEWCAYAWPASASDGAFTYRITTAGVIEKVETGDTPPANLAAASGLAGWVVLGQ